MCCNSMSLKKYNNKSHRLFIGLLIIGFENKIPLPENFYPPY